MKEKNYIEARYKSTQRSLPPPTVAAAGRAFSISRNEEKPWMKLMAGT